MAFNWDRLVKAQRDFPKPKFALDQINRHLKKRPGDVFVLAWKAKVFLQMEGHEEQAIAVLETLYQRRPPITDSHLLATIYGDTLEANRRLNPRIPYPPSVGKVGLDAWQNAAKALPNQKQRLDLWSEFFTIAMNLGCWEDVRWALLFAKKESPKNTKNVYYASILANQLSAEQKIQAGHAPEDDRSIELQHNIAYKQLKDAFDGKVVTIRVSNMGDFRFMVSIYQRQKKCAELEALWNSEHPVMAQLRSKYESDMRVHLVRAMKDCRDWTTLRKLCSAEINRVIEQAVTQESLESLKRLCATEWVVWTGFLDAVHELCELSEAEEQIREIGTRLTSLIVRYNNQGPADRSIALTMLSIAAHSKAPNLVSLLKDYWENTQGSLAAFRDLQRVVAQLEIGEQKDFHASIRSAAASLKPDAEDPREEEAKRWLHTEASILAFEFSMIISTLKTSERGAVEAFVTNSLSLYQVSASMDDKLRGFIIQLVVWGFLYLEKALATEQQDLTHLQWQAALFLRHVLADKAFKDARDLHLIATRLHLECGLGTIAFEHYQHCKVKEMLQDTLSWAFLTRISQTHPFDIGGPGGFSTDEELSKVINTIGRMEAKIDDHLYNGMQNFFYDAAFEMLELKQKLRSSLTKHMCIIESRRIARLQGKTPNPDLEVQVKDYSHISDNQDFDAIPNFGCARSRGLDLYLLTSEPPVTDSWIHHQNFRIETTCRTVYEEPLSKRYRNGLTLMGEKCQAMDLDKYDNKLYLSKNESVVSKFWVSASQIANCISGDPLGPQSKDVILTLTTLLGDLKVILDAFRDKISHHEHSMNAGEPNWPFCSEVAVSWLYGVLEFLRMFQRLNAKLNGYAKTKAAKNTPNLSSLVKDSTSMAKEIYTAIRSLVNLDLVRLETVGVDSLCDRAALGATGQILMDIIPEEDLVHHATEYVESARATLKCVLQVKLD
ncbi:hypothetical protein CC80DRAFT_509460 [Byssothecium circinans]|uniref:Uncharacterized protein n=1 Tax=Byssothecium circinans TaxID=147558 RepID=A0A6A5TDJ5_9PLEO|nr:hypothetical protein CC80DRAFT_509460 [Byssothecium circinans]